MNIKEFKSELRLMDLKYDPWGTSMDAFFQVADQLHQRYGSTPDVWQYRPSPIVTELDQESYWYELLIRCNMHQLVAIGNFLHRYTDLLKYNNQDY